MEFYGKFLELRTIARATREAVTRVRRGKVVTVPAAWVGEIPTKKTKRVRKDAALMKRHGRRAAIRREIKIDEMMQ